MPFFWERFYGFCKGRGLVIRERERGVDTNRGCNSRQLVATPGTKLIPSRKIKRRTTPPMSTSIHASLDPNSSRANDAREHTANP